MNNSRVTMAARMITGFPSNLVAGEHETEHQSQHTQAQDDQDRDPDKQVQNSLSVWRKIVSHRENLGFIERSVDIAKQGTCRKSTKGASRIMGMI
jgi:hypothetical protein